MRRASKQLINAIIALVVSVILCIGVCLAWFAMNTDVSGNGLQTQVKGGDIESFGVNAYYLDFNDSDKTNYKLATTGNVDVMFLDRVFDSGGDGKLDVNAENNDEMRSYDPSKSYSSAVLFEVNYEIKAESQKDFRIYVSCPYTIDDVMDENVFNVLADSGDVYISSVSNCVYLSEATSSGEVYSYKNDISVAENSVKFIKDDNTKNYKKVLIDGITVSDGTSGTLYFIMDYYASLFDALSAKMLELGGTLNSKLSLYGDVVFGIEEYDKEEEDPTVTSVTFVNSTSTTSQTASNDNTDNMSATWKFLITYSDGTFETVKYNEAFSVSGIDTTTTGSGTATVTYSGITVEIPYTITEPTAVTGITLNTTSKTVAVGDSFTITATVLPSDAANKTVLWESSDINVARVTDGVVTAVGKGTATITAKSEANQSISATCNVTVNAQTFTVTFNSSGKTASDIPASQSVESGGKVTAPTTNPTATGYLFVGWYKDSDCTIVFDFDTETITSETTIYAKWTSSSTIVAIFTGDDTTLASSAGFTVNGSYKLGVSFTYNGTTYNSPLKLESGTSITFSTEAEYKLTIKIYSEGGQIKVDGVVYEDTDKDGFIVINSLAAGNHSLAKASGDPNLCYVILEAVS